VISETAKLASMASWHQPWATITFTQKLGDRHCI
jgi:hypothetical protein